PAEPPFLGQDSARDAPTMQLSPGEQEPSISIDGNFDRINRAAGNRQVVTELLSEISVVGSRNLTFDEIASNFVLGFIDGMQPKDPADLALLSQMAVSHQTAMAIYPRLKRAQSPEQQ